MLCALLLLSTTWAPPPAPTRHVVDEQRQLSPAAFARLDATLRELEQRSGHQFVVYVAERGGEVPLEEFAVKSFAAWRVGREGLDDGVVLFVFTADRQARLEVGYGLEPVLPDAVASRILRERLVPALAAGDLEAGLLATVSQVISTLGEAAQPAPVPPGGWALPRPWAIALGAVALVAFIVLALVNPRAAWHLLMTVLLVGRFMGRGGRGGFGGRGGRSGGGGASARW